MIEVGTKVGAWTILGKAQPDKKRNAKWNCRCACGIERPVYQQSLLSGASTSCGCATKHLMADAARRGRLSHGETVGRSPSPEYRAYLSMKRRCFDHKDNRFHRYGGRGITVCNRWMDGFENFLLDMGRRPTPRHQIDRINNDGDYEPGNCRWATPRRQARNRHTSVEVTVFGATINLRDLCDNCGGDFDLIYGRIARGWSVNRALRQKRGPNGGAGNTKPVIDMDRVKLAAGKCQEIKMMARAS